MSSSASYTPRKIKPFSYHSDSVLRSTSQSTTSTSMRSTPPYTPRKIKPFSYNSNNGAHGCACSVLRDMHTTTSSSTTPSSTTPSSTTSSSTTPSSTTPSSSTTSSSTTPSSSTAKVAITKIWTDGSFKDYRAGIGVYFGKNDRRNISKAIYSSDPHNELSSSRAEIAAFLAALQYVSSTSSTSSRCWVIYTDCQVLQLCWNKTSHLRVHQDLWRQVQDIQKTHGSKIRIEWVRSHSNDIGNINADALANAGRMRSR